MARTKYTGIRQQFVRLRLNAWIEMDTQDVEASVAATREKLREHALSVNWRPRPTEETIDALHPWEIKVIPAGLGLPARVMVTW